MLRRKGELGPVAMRTAYKKKYGSALPGARFTQVLECFNRRLLELLLAGVEVKLPHAVGTLYVEKKKVNYDHLGLDYGHWRKTGEKLFHTNRHSDGFVAHFHWRKLTAVFTNRSLYEFAPARGACRQLAQRMKQPDGHKKYVQYLYQPKPRAKTLR